MCGRGAKIETPVCKEEAKENELALTLLKINKVSELKVKICR